MCNMDVLTAFQKGLKNAKKERKSDDIITFMRTNWKLFGIRHAYMESVVEELEQRGDLTVTSLADSLGLDKCILFHKVKVVDTAKFVLNPRKNALYDLFRKVENDRRTDAGKIQNVCLFCVAGNSTVVLTNIKPSWAPGVAYRYVTGDEAGHEVYLIEVADLWSCLPGLFKYEE